MHHPACVWSQSALKYKWSEHARGWWMDMAVSSESHLSPPHHTTRVGNSHGINMELAGDATWGFLSSFIFQMGDAWKCCLWSAERLTAAWRSEHRELTHTTVSELTQTTVSELTHTTVSELTHTTVSELTHTTISPPNQPECRTKVKIQRPPGKLKISS